MTEKEKTENAHLWGGRFAKETDELVLDFHSSISFDQKLYRQDIRGSQAHAAMLSRQGVLTAAEGEAIVQGLAAVLEDIETGRAAFTIGAEDIHMNVETLLTAKIGPVAKKLHTARSRNDQVALDVRLYLKAEIDKTSGLLLGLIETLLDLADQHVDWIMPGFTHLQIAQPITLGHHPVSYTHLRLSILSGGFFAADSIGSHNPGFLNEALGFHHAIGDFSRSNWVGFHDRTPSK